MPTPYETHLGSWTRPTTFFWAALGATFGLANVWQFPYLASQNGGGLFVLLYLACLLLVTLPLMVTEAAMGRYARHGLVLAMDGFIRSVRCSRWWLWAGRLSILAAFMVLSFTAVFGAVALAYVFYGAIGRFLDSGPTEAASILAGLVTEPDEYRVFMAWHVFFLLLVVWVSMQGVVQGLERATRVVTPTMIVLVAALCLLAGWQGEFGRAANLVLGFDAGAMSLQSLKAALFHAFYTLGLGMGVWTLFGAYTPVGTHLKRSILAVVLMDTLISVATGLMIYSLIPTGPEMAAERGLNLLFVSLPLAMSDLPGSQFLLATVYLLMVMVVWSTSLALLEPILGWFREWTGAPRGLSVVVIALAVWLAGLASLWSFNIWSDVEFAGGTFFRWLELLASGVMVPLVSILLAIFAGWHLTRALAFRILGHTPQVFRLIWLWVMRLILPLVVAYIGLQYSYSGITAMCERATGQAWCGSAEAALQRGSEATDGVEAAAEADEKASEPGPDQPQGQGAEELSPGKNSSGSEVPEKESTADEDVLFQST